MRLAFALAFVLAAAGCSGPLAAKATLSATDGVTTEGLVVIRFGIQNEQDAGELRVHSSQFHLKAGTGLFTCANRATQWRLVDVDPARRVFDEMRLAPHERIEGYLQFGLCPDVAGPYKLTWQGAGKGEKAGADAAVRLIEWDANASNAPYDLITRLARDWGEEDELMR